MKSEIKPVEEGATHFLYSNYLRFSGLENGKCRSQVGDGPELNRLPS